ncbi:MAG: carotenoid biosynthesis protein [Acidobacteria bacterium]|nr:carotenoid biosynthesis protein [Acidobacteriota bacterium]
MNVQTSLADGPNKVNRPTKWMWAFLIANLLVSAVMYVRAPAYQVLSVMVAAVCIAFIHGSLRYGVKGILVLFALCTVVGYGMENLSIATGFPFGWYHYTNLFHMPQIGKVPLDVGTLYFAMGYNAWVMSNILLDRADTRLHQAFNRIALPLVAAFIMAMWDVVLDPTTATINKTWIWHNSGGYFGVPFKNFVGWYFVVYLFFQAFTLYLASRAKHTPLSTADQGKAYWLPPVLLYLSVALGWIVTYAISPDGTSTDALGYVWRNQDIYETAAIVVLYTMLFASVLTLLRLFKPASDSTAEQQSRPASP